MTPIWIVVTVLGSAVLSAVAVAASIRIAGRIGALDHPDGGRKTQTRPIPRLGGLAVAVAYSVVVLVVSAAWGGPETALLACAALAPALVAAGIGFADDRPALDPWARLAAQAGVAVIAWAAGTRITVTGVPALDGVILVAWFLVVINGINLLDNTDGLAGSAVLVASTGAAVIAALYGQHLVSLMGFSLAGVAVGFLWHNWHPATVYLGDSGAYFLGALLAVLTIRLRPSEAPAVVGVAIAVLLAILPILDTAYVVASRARLGVHPFTAGRDHLSHRLQASGASIPMSVFALQAVALAGAVAAVVLALPFS